MIFILLSLSYIYLLFISSIQVCTTWIVHYLGELGIARKIQSHGFLASWWIVHNIFINLGNPSQVIVYYLLIGEMICLDHQNEVPMVSVLVCAVTYWIRPMVSHDIDYWVVMISPSYYIVWVFNLDRILKFINLGSS